MATKPTITIHTIGPTTESGSNGTRIKAEWSLDNLGAYKPSDITSYYIHWDYYLSGKKYLGKTGYISASKTNDEYLVPTGATSVEVWVNAYVKGTSPVIENGQLVYKESDTILCKSDTKKYDLSKAIELPTSLPAPTIEIKGTRLTASITGLDTFDGCGITFYLYKNGNSNPIADSSKAYQKVSTGAASYAWDMSNGVEYKVRYRLTMLNALISTYSSFSTIASTAPGQPGAISNLKALTPTSIQVKWNAVSSAEEYELEYTTDVSYFDTSNETQTMSIEEGTTAIVTGLEAGNTYYFRLRAINEHGESPWSKASAGVKIGVRPTAPTTWSSTTTAMVGEKVTLYWTHNTEDASNQVAAQIIIEVNNDVTEITIHQGTCSTDTTVAAKSVTAPSFGGSLDKDQIVKVEMQYGNTANSPTLNVNGTGAKAISGSYYWIAGEVVVFRYDGSKWIIQERNAKYNTTSYSIDTSQEPYKDGIEIKWRVRTRGIIENYSDDSIRRTIKVYAKPTLGVVLTDAKGEYVDRYLHSYPFNIVATAGPTNQTPIGYAISIIALEDYVTSDIDGNEKIIKNGEVVYSTYVTNSEHTLTKPITPGDVTLEKNIDYKLKCVVSMNSGLTAEDSCRMMPQWTDEDHVPEANLIFDPDTISMYIQPHCKDNNGNFIEDVTLSVYRREYDGSMTRITGEVDWDNNDYSFDVDPHPALDMARYRIVAMSKSTGNISYNDIAGYPIYDKNAIIQWDEQWKPFEANMYGDVPADASRSVSMIKIPYNIDITENSDPDVSLIEYAGRKHPVSYYGTQLGTSANWAMEIPKSDKETLYALRRLQVWMGDVYVREPSGTGYWANITVSFSQTHKELTIPITMSVVKVEGGV